MDRRHRTQAIPTHDRRAGGSLEGLNRGNAYDFGTDIHSVDYGKIYKSRFRLLKEAFDNSHIEEDPGFQEFVQKNAYWLEDYIEHSF